MSTGKQLLRALTLVTNNSSEFLLTNPGGKQLLGALAGLLGCRSLEPKHGVKLHSSKTRFENAKP